jgi:signal transduction histidine kinase
MELRPKCRSSFSFSRIFRVSLPIALPQPHAHEAALAERLESLREMAQRAANATAPEARELMQRVVAELDALRNFPAGGDEALSAFLQTNEEREKASLARELHDELGGILTPAKMDLAWLQARLGDKPEYADRMRRLNALIDQGIDLKRRVIERLRPSLLDHLGLAAAIQWYAEETCRSANLQCDIRVSSNVERLTPDLEIALYRLMQDSLANVIKHAKAKQVTVSLERTLEGLALEIGDDGVGIGDLAAARKLSYGMASMRQRVRAVGGNFDVSSAPGQGTRVRAFVPRAPA